MLEPPRRINPAEDHVEQFPCGCRVTFLGSCFHRSTRMVCCADHARPEQMRERMALMREARRRHKCALILQPPV